MFPRLWLLLALFIGGAPLRANHHDLPPASFVDVVLEEHGEYLAQLRGRVVGYSIHSVGGRRAYDFEVELLPGEPASLVTITLANQRDWTIVSTVLGSRELLLANGETARFLSSRIFVVKEGNTLTLRDVKIAVRRQGKIRELSMAYFRRLLRRCSGSLVR